MLVLVDGQRLNNSREAVNFGGVEPSLVDLGQVEAVEVIRGPASVLYGTDALGGILNLITRRPQLPAQGWVSGGQVRGRLDENADHESGEATLHFAGPQVGLELAGAVRDAGDFESPEGVVPNSGAHTSNLTARLEAKTGDASRLRLDLTRFEGRDVGLPGAVGVFTATFPETDRDKAALHHEVTAPTGWLDLLETHVFVQRQEEAFATVLDLPPFPAGPFSLAIDTVSERVSDVKTAGIDLQASSLVGDRHLLTYGLDVFQDDVEEQRLEISTTTFTPRFPGPPGFTDTETDDRPTTPDGTFTGAGVYLQDEIRSDRWTLLPGVRFDRFELDTDPLTRAEGVLPADERSAEAVSASLAALYRVTDRVRLTGTVGRAFRTPNLLERYFFGPGSQGGLTVPNPDLDDETSLNVDLGAKLEGGRTRAAVTYFHNRVDDLITFVPGTFRGEPQVGGQPVTTLDNVAEARIQGIELQAEHLLSPERGLWRLFGNVSYQRADDLSEDEPLFVPPVSGLAGLSWSERRGRVSALLTARFVAGQDRVPEGFVSTSGFTVFDLRAGFDLEPITGHPVELALGLENLTDKTYREPYGSSLEAGTRVVASVELSLGSLR